jgi:hypothetical protein
MHNHQLDVAKSKSFLRNAKFILVFEGFFTTKRCTELWLMSLVGELLVEPSSNQSK